MERSGLMVVVMVKLRQKPANNNGDLRDSFGFFSAIYGESTVVIAWDLMANSFLFDWW